MGAQDQIKDLKRRFQS